MLVKVMFYFQASFAKFNVKPILAERIVTQRTDRIGVSW